MNLLYRILVVDDEKGICKKIERILSKNNYEVVCALSAVEALERMKAESFDLMIADIVMPGMNGLELLELVKNEWPITRVLVMTAYASIDTAVRAIRLGALDYVSKPFTPDELRTVVHMAIHGDLDYNLFKRLDRTCELGNKSHPCTHETDNKSVASPKNTLASGRLKWIGIDMPFNYDDVVSVTGPEYVARLGTEEVSFVSYEALKENVARMMDKSPGEIDTDLLFESDEVASSSGSEHSIHLEGEEHQTDSTEDFTQQTAPRMEPQESKVKRLSVSKHCALVIDDEVAVNSNIRKILEKKGYRVDQAISLEEALEKINDRSYPVIMLDLKIPGVKGLELLQCIRERRPESKIVIITGYTSIETAVETARMGVVGYLAKPFTPDEILGAVESAVRIVF
jgi:DNA-binding response OmpR family regulator